MIAVLCAKRPGGFTLMELVVVLALMAVILGVSFPRIRLAMDADQERRQLDAFVAMLEKEEIGVVPRTVYDIDYAFFRAYLPEKPEPATSGNGG